MDTKKKIVELDLNDILPNRFQPRITFDEAGLLELTESIKTHGVIQPIIVRKLGDKFEIIAGERRFKACNLANLKTIPAIITDFNDKQSSEIALIENVQRRDLTPIEEAISYKRILDMNYMTQDELAKKLGKTQSTIANKLRLLNLTDDVQDALLEGKISERHARSLLRVKNGNQQKELLKRIIDERLTVRRTDEEIDNMFKNNENQEVNLNNTNRFNIPTSGIIGDDNAGAIDTDTNSGIDMLYNQATMNIPKIMGEDIQNYENKKEEQKPILNEPIEELSFGFQNQNNDFNPGFMNIDDIENNAKDIFEEKPRKPFMFSVDPEPVAPVAPVENQVEEVVEAPVVEERTPLINPMFMQPEEPAVEEVPVVENPVDTTSKNPFDFDFIPAETVNTNQVEIPELKDLEMFSTFNTETTVMNPAPVVETEVLPTSVVENVETPVVPVEPVVETLEVQPEVVTPVEVAPVVETEVLPTPVVETLSVEPEETLVVETPVVSETPVETLSFDTVENVEPTGGVNVIIPNEETEEIEILDLTGEIPVVTEEVANTAVENNDVILENPVVENVETSVAPVEPVVETLEVQPEVLPATEEVVTPVEETPVVEEKPKEEKKGFFDRLKSLVDGSNKEEKLDEPVVPLEPVVETPVVETLEVQPEVLPATEEVIAPVEVETPVEVVPTVEPEVLTMDTPVETLSFDNVENVVEATPIEPISVEAEPTLEVAPEINELNAIVDNMSFNTEETPVETEDVLTEGKKVEEIPTDIMNAMEGVVETPSILDNIAVDLDKTIELPAELAAIVSNPELTNNFANNEEVVSEIPVTETTVEINNVEENNLMDNVFSSPFENILDDVVLPEETPAEVAAVVETPVEVVPTVEPVVETIETLETPVVETLEVQPEVLPATEEVVTPVEEVVTPVVEEFKVFEPEKLPIEDDEEPVGEDLTVPLYSPIYEDTPIVIPEESEENVVNMGAAMKVIREATEQLQKLGFIVDTEEFDLEDMYQVIFKINKTNK